MSAAEPTVFLLDDEPAVLKALGRLLRAQGFCVAGFDSPQRFLDGHDPEAPGCLLLDLSMPARSGLDVQRALAERGSTQPIIFLTGRADVASTVQAMKGGAADFLTKPVDERELIAAVRRVLERDRAQRASRAVVAELRRRFAALTPREREVMALVVKGLLNKQIASALGTVEKTIKVHRARVMEKMQVASLADLVRVAEELRAAGAAGGLDQGPMPAGPAPR